MLYLTRLDKLYFTLNLLHLTTLDLCTFNYYTCKTFSRPVLYLTTQDLHVFYLVMLDLSLHRNTTENRDKLCVITLYKSILAIIMYAISSYRTISAVLQTYAISSCRTISAELQTYAISSYRTILAVLQTYAISSYSTI